MRKFFLALAMLPVLAACVTPTTAPPVSPAVTTVVGVLPQNVQDAAVKACGYLPTAQTIAQLIAAFGGPSVPGIATQIANEICAVVAQPRARRRGAATVRGIQVRGRFVR